jgi:hypothetical protein
MGRLEVLDIRGSWGRIDAFGRGRVEAKRRTGMQEQLGQPPAPRTRRARAGSA